MQQRALTRFAPTPSGFLHLGNIFSFAITNAIAHQSGAEILLRIDDLDRERMRPEYVNDIFETLHFLGIQWNRGPNDAADFEQHFSQLHRTTLYQEKLDQLHNKGLLFACNCSRTQLLADNKEGVYSGRCRDKQIPLNTPGVNLRLYTDDRTIKVNSCDGTQVNTTLHPSMKDFVVRKKDDMAAYQLASLADDIHFGVDLIVRGTDLWPSTLAQLYLADVLEEQTFQDTAFFHHALIPNSNGEKLSKSAGDTSIRFWREKGYAGQAVLSMLARHSGLEKEPASWEALCEAITHCSWFPR